MIDITEFMEFCANREGAYKYWLSCGCALAQFISSQTGKTVFVGSTNYSFENEQGVNFDIPEEINTAVFAHPRTFSALAKRLEELQ